MMTHYGDPCIHCGISHDDVPPGPCMGDLRNVIPIRYRVFSPRQDGRTHYLMLMSDGSFQDYWVHYNENPPFLYPAFRRLPEPTYDDHLSRRRQRLLMADNQEPKMGEKLTEAQVAWLDAHPTYQPVGRPRAGVSFMNIGTLYADGRFQRLVRGDTIRLEHGCVGVGESAAGCQVLDQNGGDA